MHHEGNPITFAFEWITVNFTSYYNTNRLVINIFRHYNILYCIMWKENWSYYLFTLHYRYFIFYNILYYISIETPDKLIFCFHRLTWPSKNNILIGPKIAGRHLYLWHCPQARWAIMGSVWAEWRGNYPGPTLCSGLKVCLDTIIREVTWAAFS